MIRFLSKHRWMIHKKVNKSSHFYIAKWKLLAADLNNIHGNKFRGKYNLWMDVWETLRSQAKVLLAWSIDSYPIYEHILDLQNGVPERIPSCVRINGYGAESITSTVKMEDLEKSTDDKFYHDIGHKFNPCILQKFIDNCRNN